MNVVLSSPLGHHWTLGRHGASEGDAGIRASHAAGLAVVEVAALPGQGDNLRRALHTAFGIEETGETPAASAVNAVCTGPNQYLLTGFDLDTVKAAIGSLGLAVDQSSGKVRVSIDGPAVAGLLAKTCPLNLAAWPVGGVHASHFLHLSCAYYRRDEQGFDLYFGRSFAESAAQWLIEAASEFGLDIVES